jgi:Spy/CpxP family protein refolding chaperone
MKLFIRAKFIGPIGLLLVTAGGCTTAAATDEAPASTLSEALGETAATPDSHESEEKIEQQREPYGPVAHIADALSKVGLSDQQRDDVEKLGKEVAEHEKPVVEARHALKHALTDQLKEGKIDEHELRDEINRLVHAREEASPALRQAVERLHDILDEKQREQFVDALQSRMKELRDGSKGWREELAKDLHLSEEQRSRVKEVLDEAKGNLDNERKRAAELFDAFKGKEFNIERIVPIADVGKRTRERAEGMVHVAKELTDILKPEQREELAKRLEAKHPREKGTHEPEKGTHEAEEGSSAPSAADARQAIIVGRGYRAGAVRGWGGGYTARSTTVAAGYAAGYPLIGGYGMGVW